MKLMEIIMQKLIDLSEHVTYRTRCENLRFKLDSFKVIILPVNMFLHKTQSVQFRIN